MDDVVTNLFQKMIESMEISSINSNDTSLSLLGSRDRMFMLETRVNGRYASNDRACLWEAEIQHFLNVNCIAETQTHKPRPIATM